MSGLKGLARDVRGAAAVEYALLACLVALTLAGALASLGSGVESGFEEVDRSVVNGTEYTGG